MCKFLCCSVTLLRMQNILTLNILYFHIQLNNVQQCCDNTAAQFRAQYATKTKSKMGDNSDKVVHVLQQLCSENIPVGTVRCWQAENITDKQDAILAKAIVLQEG